MTSNNAAEIKRLEAKLNRSATAQLREEVTRLADKVERLESELARALEDADWAYEQLHKLNDELAGSDQSVGITQTCELHIVSNR